MVGRTERYSDRVFYVCSSYQTGKSTGIDAKCGFHTIYHDKAEAMLAEQLRAMNRSLSDVSNSVDIEGYLNRLELLGAGDDTTVRAWFELVAQGVKAFCTFVEGPQLDSIPKKKRSGSQQSAFFRLLEFNHALKSHYDPLQRGCSWDDYGRKHDDTEFAWKVVSEKFPELVQAKGIKDFASLVLEAEQEAAAKASNRLEQIRRKHEQLTLAWVSATKRQKEVLKHESDRIELEIERLEPQTTPVSERLSSIWAIEKSKMDERMRLEAELPSMECRAKGEAYKLVFTAVRLYWDRTWLPPVAKPTRPRKTNHKGQNRYRLLEDRTECALQTTDLVASWAESPRKNNQSSPAKRPRTPGGASRGNRPRAGRLRS
jgi:hypothetical protein